MGYPDVPRQGAVDQAAQGGLAVARGAEDEQAPAGRDGEAGQQRVLLGQDQGGQAGGDVLAAHRGGPGELPLDHRRVGLERDGCRADVARDLQEPGGPLAAAARYRVAEPEGAGRAEDVQQLVGPQLLQQLADEPLGEAELRAAHSVVNWGTVYAVLSARLESTAGLTPAPRGSVGDLGASTSPAAMSGGRCSGRPPSATL